MKSLQDFLTITRCPELTLDTSRSLHLLTLDHMMTSLRISLLRGKLPDRSFWQLAHRTWIGSLLGMQKGSRQRLRESETFKSLNP